MRVWLAAAALLLLSASIAAPAVPRPSTVWRPASTANYLDSNRNTAGVVNSIVIHTGEGSYSGIISWFQNPSASASSHYVVAKSGEITQMVADNDTAWHATYYNARSIGIENEGYAGDPNNWTNEQIASLADLVAWLCDAYNIRAVHPNDDANAYGGYYTNYGVLGHYQIQTPGSAAAARYGVRTDPGSYFPWDSFMQMVQARLNGGPPPAPANLQASVDGPTQVTFSWNPAPGAEGYYVDVAQSDSDLRNMTGTFQNYDNGAATSCVWTGLTPNTTYFWRVWAYNSVGGNHGYPATTVTTPGAPPPAPTGLAATARITGATAAIRFTWDASDGADGYWVDIATSDSDLRGMTGSFQNRNVTGATEVDWTGLAQGTTYVWRVFAYNADGGTHGYASVPVTTPGGDRVLLGLGRGGNGRVESLTGDWAHEAWIAQTWTAYNAANGAMTPACGDLDGDGLEETVCGLGTYTPSGGWLVVFQGGTYAVSRWIRVGWSAYDAADGQTRPAVGDFDGDGKAEIAVGLGAPGGGYVYLYDDASTGCRFLRTIRIPWTAYNTANGETRPAAGDVDGDGRAEIVVGLGSYPGQGGWAAVFDDSVGVYALRQWIRFDMTPYNTANGDVRPACGNLDGDAAEEIVLGMGRYPANGGWARVCDDAGAAYAKIGWARVNWASYNSANGEVRPAVGDPDGDGRGEIVLGLGTSNVSAGWAYVAGDRSRGFAGLRWLQVGDAAYRSANGETWPAVGRIR